jgi:hypothetical protein
MLRAQLRGTNRYVAWLAAHTRPLNWLCSMERSGHVLIVAELAEELGIREADGRQPKSSRSILGAPPEPSPVVIR